MEPTPSTPPNQTPETNTGPDTKPAAKSNKPLLIAVFAALAVLIVLVGVLIYVLIGRDDSTNDSNSGSGNNSSQQSSNDNGGSNTSNKEIVRSIPTNDDDVTLLIYKTEQTGAGTRFEYGLKYDCEGNGCDAERRVYNYPYLGTFLNSADNRVSMLDDAAGKKYSLVEDEDGKAVANNCDAKVKRGNTLDCFVLFTSVPSGSTVDVIFPSLTIENFQIP